MNSCYKYCYIYSSVGLSSRLTNDIIDEQLKQYNRPIARVGDYSDRITPIEWRCLKCQHHWFAPSGAINRGRGCSKCTKNAWREKRFQAINDSLRKKSVTLISDFSNIYAVHNLQCAKCKYSWQSSLSIVLNRTYGCPRCDGNAPLDNELVDYKLADKPIIRLDDIISARRRIRWQCKNCSNVWKSIPDNILNKDTGCPSCNRKGAISPTYFERNPARKDAAATLYLIKGDDGQHVFLKVGITQVSIGSRFRGFKSRFSISEISCKSTTLFNAYILEQEILTKFSYLKYTPIGHFDGNTECFYLDDRIVEYFKSL